MRENIERIGKAVAEIFEIQQQIYSLQPDLTNNRPSTPQQIDCSLSTCTTHQSSSLQETTNEPYRCFKSFWGSNRLPCIETLLKARSKGFKVQEAPNPSIERTSQGLRPCAASHVKR